MCERCYEETPVLYHGQKCIAHNLGELVLEYLEEHPEDADYFDEFGKVEITLPNGDVKYVFLSELRLLKEEKE